MNHSNVIPLGSRSRFIPNRQTKSTLRHCGHSPQPKCLRTASFLLSHSPDPAPKTVNDTIRWLFDYVSRLRLNARCLVFGHAGSRHLRSYAHRSFSLLVTASLPSKVAQLPRMDAGGGEQAPLTSTQMPAPGATQPQPLQTPPRKQLWTRAMAPSPSAIAHATADQGQRRVLDKRVEQRGSRGLRRGSAEEWSEVQASSRRRS